MTTKKNGVGRRCDYCRASVTLTVRRGRPLGVRCAKCLVVFCLDCAWRHFSMRPPSWARRRKALRVKGVSTRKGAIRRRVEASRGRLGAANGLCFYYGKDVKR